MGEPLGGLNGTMPKTPMLHTIEVALGCFVFVHSRFRVLDTVDGIHLAPVGLGNLAVWEGFKFVQDSFHQK